MSGFILNWDLGVTVRMLENYSTFLSGVGLDFSGIG